jgi:hypothetical protein
MGEVTVPTWVIAVMVAASYYLGVFLGIYWERRG